MNRRRSRVTQFRAPDRPQLPVQITDGPFYGLPVVASREETSYAGQYAVDVHLTGKGFNRIAEAKTCRTCRRIDHHHNTELVPLFDVVRAEGGMIEKPEADFSHSHALGQNAEIDGKKHLRKPALKVVQMGLHLAAVPETQAMGGICQPVQAYPMIPVTRARSPCIEAAIRAGFCLTRKGGFAMGTLHNYKKYMNNQPKCKIRLP